MPNDYEVTELRRSSWRRVRERIGLGNPLAEEFGVGGIASHVSDIRFRILVLPSDHDLHVVDFNPDLKTWWMAVRPNPFGEGTIDLGRSYRVTSDAAIRYSGRTSENRWILDEYVALLRCGGVELGSGVQAIYSVKPDVAIFRLIYMVGHLWSTLHLYREVIERFAIVGPWEVSIALRNTMGSHVGNLGTGWQEPTDEWARSERPACVEHHIHIRRELAEWPSDADALQMLVFSLADNIENCWGVSERLYLSRGGPLNGRFDTSRYR
jgi:hypothetical protein